MSSTDVRATGSSEPIDLFISYKSEDLEWAQWLVHLFERLGHTTVYQHRDFPIGENFRIAIDEALVASSAVILVLTENYSSSDYTKQEWTSAQGSNKKLIPIRVEEFEPQGLLGGVTYVDIVGLEPAEAENEITESLAKEEIPASLQARGSGYIFGGSVPGYPSQQHAVPAAPADLMGRDDYLNQIAEAVDAQGGPVAVIPDPPTAQGRGCTGIVAEFVRRHAASFDKVCWVNADPPELLPLEFSRVGRELGLPPRLRTVGGVYEELANSIPEGRALVVFDSSTPAALLWGRPTRHRRTNLCST